MDTLLAITATITSGDLLTATAVGVHLGKRLATYRVGSPAATDACAFARNSLRQGWHVSREIERAPYLVIRRRSAGNSVARLVENERVRSI